MSRNALLLLACVSAGCGSDGLILLEVQSTLLVPEQCDRIEVSVVSPSAAREVGEGALDLAGPFPVSVLLEPTDTIDAALRVTVTGLLANAEVSRVVTDFEWEPDVENRLTVLLP